jgi:hypothetical protein
LIGLDAPFVRGSLTFLSPVSGRVFWSIEGETRTARIHRSAHVISDVDGNGVRDLACTGSGRTVNILSGANGAKVREIDVPASEDPKRECSISAVRSCADADGDGRADVLVSYMTFVRSISGGDGRAGVVVASSRDGRILFQRQDPGDPAGRSEPR